MEKIYFIIPAYNEEENIKAVIHEWYVVIEKLVKESKNVEAKLVIIDDGSKDSTYKIMQEEAKDKEHFIPLTKKNGGHGATVLYGYNYALEQGADYIFQTDSDGQTRPDEFYEFWEKRNEYDMIIGSRTQRQDGFSRVVVTKVLKGVIGLFFGVNVEDANTPFRLIKADSLKQYMHLIPDEFNLSNVLVSVIFAKKKAKVKYIPITFRPRQGGVNSINMKKITQLGIKAVKDFYQINKTL